MIPSIRLMLAKREGSLLKSILLIRNIHLPLLHQLQPQLLRLPQRDGKIVHVPKHLILQLATQSPQRPPRPGHLAIDLLAPPPHLLGRDVGGADDAEVWIDEEEGEDLPVAGSGAIE